MPVKISKTALDQMSKKLQQVLPGAVVTDDGDGFLSLENSMKVAKTATEVMNEKIAKLKVELAKPKVVDGLGYKHSVPPPGAMFSLSESSEFIQKMKDQPALFQSSSAIFSFEPDPFTGGAVTITLTGNGDVIKGVLEEDLFLKSMFNDVICGEGLPSVDDVNGSHVLLALFLLYHLSKKLLEDEGYHLGE